MCGGGRLACGQTVGILSLAPGKATPRLLLQSRDFTREKWMIGCTDKCVHKHRGGDYAPARRVNAHSYRHCMKEIPPCCRRCVTEALRLQDLFLIITLSST